MGRYDLILTDGLGFLATPVPAPIPPTIPSPPRNSHTFHALHCSSQLVISTFYSSFHPLLAPKFSHRCAFPALPYGFSRLAFLSSCSYPGSFRDRDSFCPGLTLGLQLLSLVFRWILSCLALHLGSPFFQCCPNISPRASHITIVFSHS